MMMFFKYFQFLELSIELKFAIFFTFNAMGKMKYHKPIQCLVCISSSPFRTDIQTTYTLKSLVFFLKIMQSNLFHYLFIDKCFQSDVYFHIIIVSRMLIEHICHYFDIFHIIVWKYTLNFCQTLCETAVKN